jgi:bis(5'-nucleosyl)-tetraphosphatase (symmetrical)
MATYVVGDLQGCYKPLKKGLKKLGFSPSFDTLYCVGDLVNRGPRSADVLRYLMDLGESVQPILGNHDLSLLVSAAGIKKTVSNSTYQQIMETPDRDDMIDWLRQKPLARWDQENNALMVHAGLYPQFSISDLLHQTQRVEALLQADQKTYYNFLEQMFGNTPASWHTNLTPAESTRFIINCCTRMRYLNSDGSLNLQQKDNPKNQSSDEIVPWFDISNPRLGSSRVFFGHWAALGLYIAPPFFGLDTGYVWGGSLTFAEIGVNSMKISCQIYA